MTQRWSQLADKKKAQREREILLDQVFVVDIGSIYLNFPFGHC